jgi:hypothetical protein
MLWQLENTPQDMDDPQPVYLSMRCIRCRGENHINLQAVEVFNIYFTIGNMETYCLIPRCNMRIKIKHKAYHHISNKQVMQF